MGATLQSKPRCYLIEVYCGGHYRARFPKPSVRSSCLRAFLQLFCDVHLRGGYETVIVKQQWPEVCMNQGIYPQMAASASQPNTPAVAALRAHYERCLLDFEEYVTSGQFESDVATHRLVPFDRVVDVPGASPAVKRERSRRLGTPGRRGIPRLE
jgi:hypothetical protein